MSPVLRRIIKKDDDTTSSQRGRLIGPFWFELTVRHAASE
jgi:hypothetical protein